jgi:hypothetical protein
MLTKNCSIGLRGRETTPRPPRHRRSKSVSFASDDDVAQFSPDDRPRPRRHRNRDYDSSDATASDSDVHEGRRRSRRRQDKRSAPRDASPAESDSTIDLPPRFDRHGRKKPEKGDDPISEKIEDLLSGKISAGKIIKSLSENFLGDKRR